MKLLLLGSGGREHALAWKIAQSPKIEKLYIAPGNAGTRNVGENVAIKADDFEAIKEFVEKVHGGHITNAAGEKFTTVAQIGIGGSDLGPRAMYLALEQWARANDCLKMKAAFISNVDPDDGAGVVASLDLSHTLFILVSKSGTTQETLANELFVKVSSFEVGNNLLFPFLSRNGGKISQ